jgi:rhodanese-related sulfurtransferase
MPKKSARRERASRNTFSAFMRKPLVQLGVVLLVALVVFLIASLNGGGSQVAGLPAKISVEQAYEKYQSGVFLLDVREPEEWNEYHVPDTTLIPLGELASRVNELPKDREIVVICRSGNRSQEGRDILLQAGFTQVTSMAGGVKTWSSMGYPTVNGP